jgi:hypothetical protein
VNIFDLANTTQWGKNWGKLVQNLGKFGEKLLQERNCFNKKKILAISQVFSSEFNKVDRAPVGNELSVLVLIQTCSMSGPLKVFFKLNPLVQISAL